MTNTPASRELPVVEEQRITSIHRRLDSPVTSSGARLKKIGKPTPEQPLIISVSELKDFLRCRVRWNLRHQARLEPTGGSINLSIGTLTHQILESWYGGKRTTTRMNKVAGELTRASSLKALQSEDRELVVAMTVGYAHWTLNPDNDNSDAQIGYNGGMPEEWFEVPLVKDGSIRLRGKYDNRFKPTTMKKTLALLEFKTASQIKMSRFDQNIQVLGYVAGMRHDHPDFKRYVVFPTVLRKQMPGPRVKADLFARELIEPTLDEVELFKKDAARAALDMLDAAIYANPTNDCSWDCDFQNPCLLRGNPADMKHVLRTEYQPKERT